MSMMVELGPDLEAEVRKQVDSGRYLDAEEMVNEAFRLLQERDAIEDLRAKLKVGLDQIERGEYDEWTPALYEKILETARQRFREGKQPKADVCP